MDSIKENFPAANDFYYLNTPAIGLISKPVYDFKKNQIDKLYHSGSQMMESNLEIFPQVREKIAKIFGARPENVTLLPAFSFGLNAILEGLKPKQKVLLLDNDYPSINKAVEARDFKISYVKIDAHLEERIYDSFKKNPPDVFIFSQVQYLSGIKIDFSFIKKLKKEFPNTVLIGDGTQYLGTEDFDFENSGLDMLGSSGYKWLGAGLGNGFFIFKSDVKDYLNPKFIGFGSTLGKYKDEGDTLIGKFEGSHLDPTNIGSLKIALEELEKLDFQKIKSRIQHLTHLAKTAFSEMNLLEDAVLQRKEHSSIFNLKADDQMFENLIRNNILCSQRGEGVRIGIHYYNQEEDIEKLTEVLRRT